MPPALSAHQIDDPANQHENEDQHTPEWRVLSPPPRVNENGHSDRHANEQDYGNGRDLGGRNVSKEMHPFTPASPFPSSTCRRTASGPSSSCTSAGWRCRRSFRISSAGCPGKP